MSQSIEIPYGYRYQLEQAKATLSDLSQRRTAGDPRVSQRDLQIAANQLDNVERQIVRYREIEQARLDEQAEHQQAREVAAANALEEYKQQARGAFPGTAAEFEAAWPAIKQQRQLELMQQALVQPEADAQRRLNSSDPGWVPVPMQQDVLR